MLTLTVTLSGNGGGVVTSTPEGLSCPGSCALSTTPGTEVTLSAAPAAGSVFLGWSGGCSGTGPCQVTPSSNATLIATFALKNALVVSRAGSGTGTVVSSPAGIDCGVDCSEAFPPDTVVTLSATPEPGSVFAGWSGACSGMGPCGVTTSVAQLVTATFSRSQATLNVTKDGNGMGTVLSVPPGIACGATCAASFDTGSMVTLTVAPSVGAVFTGWSGACTGTGACLVTVAAAVSVTATLGTVLVIAPTTKTLAVTNTVTFSASGGVGPFAFSVQAGVGNVDASTGLYTAPGAPGTAVVRVTDAGGNTADASVTVVPAVVIAPTTRTLSIGNSFTFTSSGGVPPFVYSVPSGGGTIEAMTGLFTAAAPAGTTLVRVTDSLGNTADANVTVRLPLAITPAIQTLAIDNTFTFNATGGVPPYTFSLLSGGGSVGGMTGLYTAPGAPGTAVVRVTDAASNTSDATVTVNAALVITPATKTLTVQSTFTFSATGGVTPYTFSLLSGGGTTDGGTGGGAGGGTTGGGAGGGTGGGGSTDGTVGATTGTYTAPGVAGAAVVRVTDALGNTSDANVTVTALFGAATSFPAAANTPQGLTTGDWNGDGRTDLAVSSFGSTVTILLGAGNGTFLPPASSGTNGSTSVTSGDWNGDGKADLAVTTTPQSAIITGKVAVLMGVGNGTFLPAVSYAAGSSPFSVTSGDWNHDGKADLAVANQGSNDVSVLLGVGDGTFLAAVPYPAGTMPFSVTAGDWNGDGKADLAVANLNSNDVSILLGVGNGTFQAAVPYPAGIQPFCVTSADLNGDGKADLVVGANTVTVLLGVGNGTFQPALSSLAGVSPRSVAVADWNGDGKPDLAAANFSGGDLSVFLGLGNGTFRPALTYAAGSTPGSVTAGDWNGDGKPDLVVANQASNDVHVLLNQSSPLQSFDLAARVNYSAGTRPSASVQGDWNGDGKADLATANLGGDDVSILLGTGNGTFLAATHLSAGTSPTALATGDFNGDGKADLAVTNQGGVSVLLGVGTGTFLAAVSYGAGSAPWAVTTGDWNHDGKADLAVGNGGSNNVSILLGLGNGTFQAAVNYPVGAAPCSVTAGDWNGDGKADLAVVNQNGNTLSVLLGVGNGTFLPAVAYATGTLPYAVTAGDWNGDGWADLAVVNANGNDVSILLGAGNGTFAAAFNYGCGRNPRSVAAGDWNGDGKLDLAVGNFVGGGPADPSGSVSILLGVGDGSFQTAVGFVADLDSSWVTAGDWNGDGKPDFAVTNDISGNVSILLNQSR